MYYIYIGRNHNLKYPDKLIVEYEDNYFERNERTDWEVLDTNLKEKLLSGDDSFYAIEEDQFNSIISSWGGSKSGYKNLNIKHLYDNHGYGDEYDN